MLILREPLEQTKAADEITVPVTLCLSIYRITSDEAQSPLAAIERAVLQPIVHSGRDLKLKLMDLAGELTLLKLR